MQSERADAMISVELISVETISVETISVELIEAWPREYRSHRLVLPVGACVGDALDAAAIAHEAYPAVAVYGERAQMGQALADGDRVELLRPLQADPKQSRRRRADHRRNAGSTDAKATPPR